jgi:hypothetical protein
MQLKQQINSPFKMKNEVDSLKSNCILETEQAVEPHWLNIKNLLYKLGIKSVQNNRIRIDRDEFNKQTIQPNPVFSENQIAWITSKYRELLRATAALVTAESSLYYLTSALFVPDGLLFMKILVAIFLAFLILHALNYGQEKHFLYREAVERHSRKELNDFQLRRYRDKRNIGYILILLSFAAIILSGLARIFFLEHVPTTGLDPAKAESVRKASKAASIFTMLITIIAAIYLGAIKQELRKYKVKYRVFKSWHRAHTKRNECAQELIKSASLILLMTEQCIEKYWQLVIDLKRVYKMDTEYDPKFEELHQEYMGIKSKPGFILGDHLYRRFSPVQSGHEELFRFGILNAKEIKDKLIFINEILKMQENYIVEHLSAITGEPGGKENSQPVPEMNGKPKEQEFSTI